MFDPATFERYCTRYGTAVSSLFPLYSIRQKIEVFQSRINAWSVLRPMTTDPTQLARIDSIVHELDSHCIALARQDMETHALQGS